MNDIDKIVNLAKYPIFNSNEFIIKCNNNLRKNSILQLNNFLTKECLINLQKEAKKLHSKAFYCSQMHTILLSKKDKKLPSNDPCNIEVKSDKGCVPHDLIPSKSYLNQLYKSNKFKEFIIKVLGIKNIYPYKDKLSSINYNYYEKNQQLGWHFDNASFAITIMIRSSDSGGDFQYFTEGRDYDKKIINKLVIKNILDQKVKIKELKVNPGTLVLFYGRNYLHRVTPVKSEKGRVLVTLNYNLEKNIELSKNARKIFFGRSK